MRAPCRKSETLAQAFQGVGGHLPKQQLLHHPFSCSLIAWQCVLRVLFAPQKERRNSHPSWSEKTSVLMARSCLSGPLGRRSLEAAASGSKLWLRRHVPQEVHLLKRLGIILFNGKEIQSEPTAAKLLIRSFSPVVMVSLQSSKQLPSKRLKGRVVVIEYGR